MTSPSCVGRSRLAAVVLASGLALCACDRRTPTSVAVHSASIKLHALSPDGTSGPSVADRTKMYNEVLTSLKPVADQGRNGEIGAAYLLISQAQAGLAEGPASEAALNERLALNEIQAVRDALAQWLNANAMAEAAASYSPTKELADIDSQVKEKQDLRLGEQQKKAAVDANVAGILAQAKAKGDQAKAKRQESGQLKAQLANQTAVQAEVTLKHAQEIGRVADGLEVEASNLEARAAQVSPESGEIQLQIDKLSSQKDLLEASRASVLKRAESAKAHADEARAAAAAAANEVKKRLAALEARRDGDLAKATESAISGYQSAVAAAKKAGNDAKSTAQMAAGSAQQSLGSTCWAKAHGLTEYAALLELLATAKPALPDSGQYKSKATKAREEAKAALDQATEAYSAANDSYKSGGGAAMKERLDSVNRSLAEIVSKTSGGSKDIRDTDAPKEEAPATGTPSESAPSAAIDPGSPQATIQALFDVENNNSYDTVADLFLVASPQDKETLKSVLSVGPKMKKLDEAMKAKFGKGLAELAGEMGGMKPPEMGVDSLKDMKASSLDVKIEGDTATAELPTGKPLKLVKKDGKWLIDGVSLGLDPAQLAIAATMIGPMGKAAEEVTADVAAGKYPDGRAALMALSQKMMTGIGLPKKPDGK